MIVLLNFTAVLLSINPKMCFFNTLSLMRLPQEKQIDKNEYREMIGVEQTTFTKLTIPNLKNIKPYGSALWERFILNR